MGRWRAGVLAVALAVPLAGLSGCRGDSPAWGDPVALDGEAAAVVATSRGPVVGTWTQGQARPRLRLVEGTRTTDIPTTPAPGYGREARWASLAVAGDRLTAIGGARGGAHANVRWTEWSGDLTSVRDVPQSFWTFGGWEAGDLVGVAYLGDRPVIVGGWASPTSGFDIAAYELDGQTWRRDDPAGTPLASTRQELLSAAGMASTGDSVVVVGSSLHLDTGLRSTAEAWTGTRTASGRLAWTRTSLPGDAPAEAMSVACTTSECLVAGRSGGHLTLWTLRDGRVTSSTVDDVPVGDEDGVLQPARGAQWLVVARTRSGAHLVTGSGEDWAVRDDDLPRTETPVALAGDGRTAWLVTTVGDGSRIRRAADRSG